jgi:hypothetical protein
VFTEGIINKTIADTITLEKATSLMYTLITNPNAGCKTCGRIPLRNLNNGTEGGILKIDFKNNNACIGKCVGPNSFSTATSPSPSPSASASAKSAAGRLEMLGLLQELGMIAFLFWSVL